MRHSTLLALFLVGCSSAPTTVVELPKAAPTAAAPTEPPKINVQLASHPSGGVIDGDTSEWKLDTREHTSNVAVAITSEAVVVAAELGHPSPDGFWLGLAAPHDPMLYLSEFGMAGNVTQIDCSKPGHMHGRYWTSYDEDTPKTAPPYTPQERTACEALVGEHSKRQAEYSKRFRRLLRIEATGVRVMDGKGELGPLQGAQVVWKPSKNGVAAEISMPLAALPRLAQAPLTRLFAWANPANDPPITEPPTDADKALKFPTPVVFEPLGMVRAGAFLNTKAPLLIANSRIETRYPWSGLSYDPANLSQIEWVRFGETGQDVVVEQQPLYEKKASLGEIEVGQIRAFKDWLAVFRKGAPKSVDDLNEGLRAVVVRDGEIHAISYMPAHYKMSYGSIAPSWDIIAIGEYGNTRDPVQDVLSQVLEDPKKGGLGCVRPGTGPAGAMKGTESASPTFDTFGWKGECQLRDKADTFAAFEMNWKWDAAKKQYVGTWRKLATPKPKK